MLEYLHPRVYYNSTNPCHQYWGSKFKFLCLKSTKEDIEIIEMLDNLRLRSFWDLCLELNLLMQSHACRIAKFDEKVLLPKVWKVEGWIGFNGFFANGVLKDWMWLFRLWRMPTARCLTWVLWGFPHLLQDLMWLLQRSTIIC